MRRLCLALGILALSLGGLTFDTARSEAQICPTGFCAEPDDCWAACPQAATVTCTATHRCKYTF